jgi:hypothetical protein
MAVYIARRNGSAGGDRFMNQGIRRWVVYTGIFVLGVALYVVMVIIGVTFGLNADIARLLAFGGLAAYSLAVAIVVLTRRR